MEPQQIRDRFKRFKQKKEETRHLKINISQRKKSFIRVIHFDTQSSHIKNKYPKTSFAPPIQTRPKPAWTAQSPPTGEAVSLQNHYIPFCVFRLSIHHITWACSFQVFSNIKFPMFFFFFLSFWFCPTFMRISRWWESPTGTDLFLTMILLRHRASDGSFQILRWMKMSKC